MRTVTVTPFERWYRRNFGTDNWLFFWPLYGGLIIVWFIASMIQFPQILLG